MLIVIINKGSIPYPSQLPCICRSKPQAQHFSPALDHWQQDAVPLIEQHGYSNLLKIKSDSRIYYAKTYSIRYENKALEWQKN